MAIERVLTPILRAELEMELEFCKEIKLLTPDYAPKHHGPGCGCPWLLDDKTGLYDSERHVFLRMCSEHLPTRRHVVYDTDYPFFICVECKKLVPWCFGCCGDEDEYIDECCDNCAVMLMEPLDEQDRVPVEDRIDAAEYALGDRRELGLEDFDEQ